MKYWRMLAAAAVLFGAAALRFFLPDFGDAAREKVLAIFGDEKTYAAVFGDLSDHLSLRNDVSENNRDIRSPHPRYITVEVSADAALPPDKTPAQLVLPVSAAEHDPECSSTEEALPACVEAFLISQTEFSENAFPDSVDYTYVNLPFESCAPIDGRNSSGFGYRLHPILNTIRFHYGTDIAAWSGEQISAFADGTVCFAGYDESYGWHIIIDHGDGWKTMYAHCSKLLVEDGQQICRGERIALVGSSGLATGPHLHFELTKDGQYRNPEYYINN